MFRCAVGLEPSLHDKGGMLLHYVNTTMISLKSSQEVVLLTYQQEPIDKYHKFLP